MRVAWPRSALADLGHIHDHLADENPAAASRLAEAIEGSAAVLSRHPEIGRTGRVKGTRELVVVGTPFVIPYRIRRERVEVLAIIHGARRWPESC